jgi:hypothetical protein
VANLPARSLLVPGWPGYACLALALLFLARDRPRGLALGLLAAVATTALGIVALALSTSLDPPYPRNVLFLPLFAWLGVLFATRARPAVVVLLAVSAAVEVACLIGAFRPGGDPNAHPYLHELNPVPMPREGFEWLECRFQIMPLCQLYAHNRPVRALLSVPETCASGKVRPDPGQSVVLGPGSRLLCY